MEDLHIPNRVIYWLDEAKHDCFFVVGPESGPTERVGAIKTLLMGDSEPFRSMLGDGEMAEKGDIPVKDVEPDTFRNFLKCIYGASHPVIPKLTFEEKAKLLYVFEKYLVDDLKNKLIKDMEDTLSFENIFVALSHPVCHVTPSLKSKMTSIVIYNLERLVSDARFLEVNNGGIKWILQLDFIPVEEIELWHAVLKWAKSKTDSVDGNVLRQCIFDLLKDIRFLTMKNNEFWDGVVSTEILNKEEVSAICRSFVSGKPHDIEYLSETTVNRFNRHPVAKRIKSCLYEYPKYLSKPHSAHFHSSVLLEFLDTQKNQYSQSYPWTGHFWYLLARYDDYFLSLNLGCYGKTEYFNCKVYVEISLINQCGKSDVTNKFTATFSPSSREWGYAEFYVWDALVNEDNGFVKDNSIIVVVKIQLIN